MWEDRWYLGHMQRVSKDFLKANLCGRIGHSDSGSSDVRTALVLVRAHGKGMNGNRTNGVPPYIPGNVPRVKSLNGPSPVV